MNWKQRRLFMRHWRRYTIHDAFAQTFGWLTLFGGSFGGFILAKVGVRVPSDQLTISVVGAVGGFVIGVGVYAMIGFFKTRRYMQPLIVSVTDEVRSPGFTCSDQFHSYNVAAIVQNRSDVHLKDCIAYVMNAPRGDGSTGPRFIEKFDLPPKLKKVVFIAYWVSREPPYTDDKDIGIAGPVASGYGGNVCRVPGTETILHIRIHPQDINSKDAQCRMWIDTTARRLRASPIPD